MSDDSDNGGRDKKKKKKKSSSKKRSRSTKERERSRSPLSRCSRSSSRGTFDGIDVMYRQTPPSRSLSPPPSKRTKSPEYYSCKQCRGTYESIKELATHELRNHPTEIVLCYHCDKKSVSVDRLAAHTKYRHGPKPVICGYCQDSFGKSSELMTDGDWDEFRDHIFKEAVKKQMHNHGARPSHHAMSVALRGIGACPHGPPVKCKNFPQCPGAKCIYSHNPCRYESTCNKQTCPFDHPNRPRTCMTCVNDMKSKRNYSNRNF